MVPVMPVTAPETRPSGPVVPEKISVNILLERRSGAVARVGPAGLPGVIDLPRVTGELYRTARVLRVFTFERRRMARDLFLEIVGEMGGPDAEPSRSGGV